MVFVVSDPPDARTSLDEGYARWLHSREDCSPDDAQATRPRHEIFEVIRQEPVGLSPPVPTTVPAVAHHGNEFSKPADFPGDITDCRYLPGPSNAMLTPPAWPRLGARPPGSTIRGFLPTIQQRAGFHVTPPPTHPL